MTRYIIALTLALHGIGHMLFVGTALGLWRSAPSGGWLLAAVGQPGSLGATLIGLLWLLPLGGFLYGAWGCASGAPGWFAPIFFAALASTLLALVWWEAIDTASATFAMLFNLAVIAAWLWQATAEQASAGV